MSFLLVDQILSDDPGVAITGVKFIQPDDPYLTHEDKPMFMPALIGETLGQLAAWSVINAGDYQCRPVAGVTRDVTWHQPVYPGDSVDLCAKILRWDNQAVEYQAIASMDNKPVFTLGRALGPMLPMAEFINDTEIRTQYQQCHHPKHSPNQPPMAAVFNPDKILTWEPGQWAIAEKFIDPNFAFFPDHFPKKPVLPLTVLLQIQTQLGEKLLSRRLKTFTRVKMREFVNPGANLLLDIKVKSPERALFTAQVNNKTICTAEALFHD